MRKLFVLGLMLVSAPVMAGQQNEESALKQSDNYDVLYARYLKAARELPVTASAPDTTWMTGLMGDLRARHVNDLVTIRVTESISGVGAADSNLDKSGSASASLTKLFGLESVYPKWLDPTSLVAGSSNTTFKGGGSTTRSSELTAMLSARVIEVLPNGDLALEGVREVDINGDIQILVLTGVVRTADIRPGNIVPSSQIGQMRIRYFGRGLMKDNLKPGWIIRVMNKIF
jgi:flagellar L-ring protein precursor FlgH